jgi:hypothetical protein
MSISPAALILRIAGPEEAKNLAGRKGLRLIRNPYKTTPSLERIVLLVKTIRCKSESQIRVQETPSAFHPLAQ